MQIPIVDITFDERTQPRAKLIKSLIDEYATQMEAGDVFPPIVLFDDGEFMYCADGWHRARAAEKVGMGTIEADVQQGTIRDAILHSVGANVDHGKRRTNDDKNRSVDTILKVSEWEEWSDPEIARQCRVTQPFVWKIRTSLITVIGENKQVTYKNKHGQVSTMDSTNIGGNAE